MAKDYTTPATIASGEVQNVGASKKDKFVASTNADGLTWAMLTPTAGRKVIQWLIINRGAVDLEVGYGESAKAHTLKPNESIAPPWNGAVHLKSASAAACAYEATAFEV